MLIGIAGLLTIAMLLWAPLALLEIYEGTRTDWRLLSEIGQTYGAASALLSAGACLAAGAALASRVNRRRGF
ncbi:hypothetical protein ACQEU3_12965 [Spirillospora sp. CA-253888]